MLQEELEKVRKDRSIEKEQQLQVGIYIVVLVTITGEMLNKLTAFHYFPLYIPSVCPYGNTLSMEREAVQVINFLTAFTHPHDVNGIIQFIIYNEEIKNTTIVNTHSQLQSSA